MPQRIQRKRTKGWRMPAGAVYVGRPTKWGNPYVVHVHTLRCSPMHALCPLWVADDREQAARLFRHDLLFPVTHHPQYPDLDTIRAELAGRDLVCWCPLDQPCHADVLLELANGGDPQ
ncbi:DUF4326 domain-containing protein [Gordonia terrae]|uniref:DUF4326 domain-containing protein n=1 Tax=Gordonia terrae TaxID=2055 RepID=UPI003F6CAF9B